MGAITALADYLRLGSFIEAIDVPKPGSTSQTVLSPAQRMRHPPGRALDLWPHEPSPSRLALAEEGAPVNLEQLDRGVAPGQVEPEAAPPPEA